MVHSFYFLTQQLTDRCWYSFSKEGVQNAVTEGVYRVLIPLMRHMEEAIREFATAALMYISNDPEGRRQCLSEGIVPILCRIALQEESSAVLLNSFKLIGNLSQSLKGRTLLLESGIMDLLEESSEGRRSRKEELTRFGPSVVEAAQVAMKRIKWRP